MTERVAAATTVPAKAGLADCAENMGEPGSHPQIEEIDPGIDRNLAMTLAGKVARSWLRAGLHRVEMSVAKGKKTNSRVRW